MTRGLYFGPLSDRPKRLLVVCPSWLGDVVMATPALRLMRSALPGAFIGGLVRPGLDELLAGTDFFDELHVDRAAGVMGPKLVAAKVRPRRYDAAALLTNSFSTALITRLAFIPRRVGYDRDGRGLLLTERLKAPRRADGRWACVPAVEYYLRVAEAVVGDGARWANGAARGAEPPRAAARLELGVTESQAREGVRVLEAAGVGEGERVAVINPGANNEAKRWPAERFGEIAAWLAREGGFKVLVNGSPGEREVVERVVGVARGVLGGECEGVPTAGVNPLGGGERRVVGLTELGVTIGSLKAVVRRAGLMVTNDTGPRHIAAAFGVPTVTLFGPTDPRWTTLPTLGGARRAEVVADPTLPEGEIADDHPDRCRIDRIGVERVQAAVEEVLGPGWRGGVVAGGGGGAYR